MRNLAPLAALAAVFCAGSVHAASPGAPLPGQIVVTINPSNDLLAMPVGHKLGDPLRFGADGCPVEELAAPVKGVPFTASEVLEAAKQANRLHPLQSEPAGRSSAPVGAAPGPRFIYLANRKTWITAQHYADELNAIEGFLNQFGKTLRVNQHDLGVVATFARPLPSNCKQAVRSTVVKAVPAAVVEGPTAVLQAALAGWRPNWGGETPDWSLQGQSGLQRSSSGEVVSAQAPALFRAVAARQQLTFVKSNDLFAATSAGAGARRETRFARNSSVRIISTRRADAEYSALGIARRAWEGRGFAANSLNLDRQIHVTRLSQKDFAVQQGRKGPTVHLSNMDPDPCATDLNGNGTGGVALNPVGGTPSAPPASGFVSKGGDTTASGGPPSACLRKGSFFLTMTPWSGCLEANLGFNDWFGGQSCVVISSNNLGADGQMSFSDEVTLDTGMRIFGAPLDLLHLDTSASFDTTSGPMTNPGTLSGLAVELGGIPCCDPIPGPSAVIPLGFVPLLITSSLNLNINAGQLTPAVTPLPDGCGAGPVPVVSISGKATATASAGFDASISAVVASAGVDGQVTLVGGSLNGSVDTNANLGANLLTVTPAISFDSDIGSGYVNAYVEVDLLVTSKRWELNLLSWDGAKNTTPLSHPVATVSASEKMPPTTSTCPPSL